MVLSDELVALFVKATNDSTNTSTEATVYGTVRNHNDAMYVQIDGSDQLTPISTTTNVADGERVTVLIKNHTATIMGNISSPSARTDDVTELGNTITKQLEVEEAKIKDLYTETATIAGQLTAQSADIKDLKASNVEITNTLTAAQAEIGTLKATSVTTDVLEANYATIESLEAVDAKVYNLDATFGDFKELTADSLNAIDANIKTLTSTDATISGTLTAAQAEIDTLKATDATITGTLTAVQADIKALNTDRVTTEDLEAVEATIENLDAKYADIGFANITEAAVKKIFADYGVIEELEVSEGKVTKQLIAVEIDADLIKSGTLQVDRLILKGEDGLYYKMNVAAGATTSEQITEDDLQNGLSGSIIVANSVTADKISVTDLMAFGATIAGFHIEDLEANDVSAIYSGTKNDVSSGNPGIYMDENGQFAAGDTDNYLKFYKDENGQRQLDIRARKVLFGSNGTDVETAIDGLQEFKTNAGQYIQFSMDPEHPAITIGSTDNAKQLTLEIDDDGIRFKKNGEDIGYWDGDNFHTGNIVVEVNERAQFGNFAYVPRKDGSLSFLKVGG